MAKGPIARGAETRRLGAGETVGGCLFRTASDEGARRRIMRRAVAPLREGRQRGGCGLNGGLGVALPCGAPTGREANQEAEELCDGDASGRKTKSSPRQGQSQWTGERTQPEGVLWTKPFCSSAVSW